MLTQCISVNTELLASFEATGVANSTQTQDGDANEDSDEAGEEMPHRHGPHHMPSGEEVDHVGTPRKPTTQQPPAQHLLPPQHSSLKCDRSAMGMLLVWEGKRKCWTLSSSCQCATTSFCLTRRPSFNIDDIPELTQVNLLLSILFLHQQSEYVCNVQQTCAHLDERSKITV